MFTVCRLGRTGVERFARLTYPHHRAKLRRCGEDAGVLAIGACTPRGLAAGLALGELRDNGEAVLDTLFVAKDHRRQGVGRALLDEVELTAARRGCQRLSIRLAGEHPATPGMVRLFRARGWLPPRDAGRVYRLNLADEDDDRAPSFLELDFPRDTEVFSWTGLGSVARAEILAGEGIWYPAHLSPFLHEEKLEPLNSLGLRSREGRVMAWVITQRLDPGTILIRHLFCREEVRHLGYAMLLVGEALLLQFAQGIWGVAFHVDTGNEGMLKLVRRLVQPYPHRVSAIVEIAKPLPHGGT